jgi:hypothetical protein
MTTGSTSFISEYPRCRGSNPATLGESLGEFRF